MHNYLRHNRGNDNADHSEESTEESEHRGVRPEANRIPPESERYLPKMNMVFGHEDGTTIEAASGGQ